jgi:hypothetical protein
VVNQWEIVGFNLGTALPFNPFLDSYISTITSGAVGGMIFFPVSTDLMLISGKFDKAPNSYSSVSMLEISTNSLLWSYGFSNPLSATVYNYPTY